MHKRMPDRSRDLWFAAGAIARGQAAHPRELREGIPGPRVRREGQRWNPVALSLGGSIRETRPARTGSGIGSGTHPALAASLLSILRTARTLVCGIGAAHPQKPEGARAGSARA